MLRATPMRKGVAGCAPFTGGVAKDHGDKEFRHVVVVLQVLLHFGTVVNPVAGKVLREGAPAHTDRDSTTPNWKTGSRPKLQAHH